MQKVLRKEQQRETKQGKGREALQLRATRSITSKALNNGKPCQDKYNRTEKPKRAKLT